MCASMTMLLLITENANARIRMQKSRPQEIGKDIVDAKTQTAEQLFTSLMANAIALIPSMLRWMAPANALVRVLALLLSIPTDIVHVKIQSEPDSILQVSANVLIFSTHKWIAPQVFVVAQKAAM